MKIYKWVLCVVLVIVLSGGIFLLGNFRSGDSDLNIVPQTTTVIEEDPQTEITEFTFDEGVYNTNVLSIINAYREKNGFQPWDQVEDFTIAAKTRAHECVLLETKSHERPDGQPWYTVVGILEGENYNFMELIGCEDQDPASLLRNWVSNEDINSSVLLSDEYVSCGIGCEAVGNTVYCVLIAYKN